MDETRSRQIGLGILAAGLTALPLLLRNPFHYEIAILVVLNATVCVGINMLIGYAGQISLGHAGFFALGAYGSAILTSRGWPAPAALCAAAAAVGLLSFAVARGIMHLKGHYLAMATLGLGIIIAIVLNREIGLTGGPDGMVVPPFTLFGWEPTGGPARYAIAAVLLILAVWASLNVIDSPIGRALRAIHGSEVAAQVMGVHLANHKNLMFIVSAVLASVCGSLYAHFNGFITPAEADFGHSIEFVTMVVLGGMASVFGAVAGAAALTVLPQVLAGLEDYEMIGHGLVLMGVLIFLPQGLVPSLARLLGGSK